MPTTRVATDAFGVVTISLVALTAILGLLCIYRCVYFQLQIRRKRFSQLSYFNGPWIIRIVLIIISIWWGFGEIVRLSFLRGTGRPLSNLTWQKYGCKFYVLSNLGFAEPIIFLMLGFLLHAALSQRESDSLTQRWNKKKTFVYVILLCLPLFILQLVIISLGPKYNSEMQSRMRKKMAKFFMTYSLSLANNMTICICTYPLLSTIILGFFHLFVIGYVVYGGVRMLSLVINKGLRRRVYFLAVSVIVFLPLRVMLLGFSVLPHVGNMAYEVLVFVAFLMLLLCNMIGIFMLVYLPVADSLALREIDHNDTFKTDEGTSLIHNPNHPDPFVGDDLPHALNKVNERSVAFAPLHIVSSAQSSHRE